MKKPVILIILSFFSVCHIDAQRVLPVLPLPVHIETGDLQNQFFKAVLALDFKGVDNAVKNRLVENWNEFSKTQTAETGSKKIQVQIGLIGKDK